jgi:LysM domain
MEPQATQMRPSRNPVARTLAVIALLAAAIVLVVVVSGSIGSGGGGTRQHAGPAQGKPTSKYYVVQPGDTFGGIAAKEGVPIGRLEKLNPKLDTQLLPQKGCVDLVPDGCKVLANGG